MITKTIKLATPQSRIYAFLAELAISILTLGIGWLIWSAYAWGKGTTPGHQLLKHQIVNVETNQPLSWAQMAVRELLFKGVIGGILSSFTYGLYAVADAGLMFRNDRRAIHDWMSSSVVIQSTENLAGKIRF
ncbi:MAG: RDD family protein [Actinomycetes bacterium]